jgi:putative ABC transport system permease protein
MIRNYIKIAWRNLTRNKIFSLINIFGLSVGLACCMLIVLYLYGELAYDSYHKNIKQLYQVGTIFITNGKRDRFPAEPAIMARNMQQSFPEIEMTARVIVLSFFGENKTLIQYKLPDGTIRSFYEPKGCAADASFFKLFDYHFVEGSSSTALKEPNSVVISEDMAKKIFGNQPALNKIIHFNTDANGEQDCIVSGVFEPGDRPSHIDAHFFISLYGGSLEERMRKDGSNMTFDNLYTTYLLLKPNTDEKKLEAKFPAFVDKYAGKDLKEAGFYRELFLLPVKDIHLHADMMEMTPSGSVSYLFILGSIAVFIILIACINFMNLSTARSSIRSVEVGVRKALGASRASLLLQFFGESLFMSLIAFVFAIIIMAAVLPAFESVSGKSFTLFSSSYIILAVFFFVLSVITGFIASIYPAFYLSSFNPVAVLKGRFSTSLTVASLRKGLVVLQFVISVILIISTIVISGQMIFLRSTDLGFAKDQQIVIPLHSLFAKKMYPVLKKEMVKNGQVVSVGASVYYPGISNAGSENFHKEGDPVNGGPLLRLNNVDESFLQTLAIKPIAGRLFSAEFKSADLNQHIILNADAVKKLGFASPQDAIGKKIYNVYKSHTYTSVIVGVTKDFHFEDLHMPITPYGFYLDSSLNLNYAIVHAGPGDVSKLLMSLETTWRGLDPGEPFDYSFLDDDFQKNYVSDNRLSELVNYFTLVAILISCLGLFGLATFSAEQRSKEISMRKVLGASNRALVVLLSKDFLKLVFIAVIIACPVAWLAMNKWLQNFTSRIQISWWIFGFTAIIVLLIAFATISSQVIRAALVNPAKTLKNE